MDIRVKRRSVAKGAAWAAPALVLATAAPAMAISGPGPVLAYGDACKNPGNSCRSRPKGYTIPVQICNNDSVPIYIYTVTYSNVVGSALTFTYAPPPALPLMVSPGCLNVFFNAASGNSANQTFTMDVTVTWGHTPTAGADPDPHPPVTNNIRIPATPPECGCP